MDDSAIVVTFFLLFSQKKPGKIRIGQETLLVWCKNRQQAWPAWALCHGDEHASLTRSFRKPELIATADWCRHPRATQSPLPPEWLRHSTHRHRAHCSG